MAPHQFSEPPAGRAADVGSPSGSPDAASTRRTPRAEPNGPTTDSQPDGWSRVPRTGTPVPPSDVARRVAARLAAALGAGRHRRPACPRPPVTTRPTPGSPDEGQQPRDV